MRAAWYERQGPAREVLEVGEMETPQAGPGEVRIAVFASGVNPGDVKKRLDTFGYGMPYPRIVPHSDAGGTIDQVGDGVSERLLGRRVWCFGAQSYRPFGTAAEFVVVPVANAVVLPAGIPFESGACLGIPGITAHRAVHAGGPVRGRNVLVQGGGGAVGQCAAILAQRAGARVIATVRSEQDAETLRKLGLPEAVRTDGCSTGEVVDRLRAAAPGGFDHIVEVAFGANVAVDEAVLKQGGSIAAYATGDPGPTLPFWPLLFKNTRLFLIGSDDVPADAKAEAADALNLALMDHWGWPHVDRILPLEAIAEAHELVESGAAKGRVLVKV